MSGRTSSSPPAGSRILVLGLNHKTAPVALRECLSFAESETDAALDALRGCAGVHEALIVSTCNRMEVLVATDDADATTVAVKAFIARFKHQPLETFEDAFYRHLDDEAVRHVLRVAASLDSMVVGEPQILGQIKTAYAAATRCKATGVLLNRLLHRTFFTAKRIRTETGIGDHAVSISYAAIELARKIFGTLKGRPVLLIGAGEMAELAVEHLIRHRAGDIFVANRTFARGAALAKRFGGQALRYEEIGPGLDRVDIIISSTGAPGFVLTRQAVRGVLRRRRNRPLFFIDIAVPRDIDPQINRLANVYVYDIDDLQGVVAENIEDRQREALRAERIVDEAVLQFGQWQAGLAVVPTIVGLRRKLEAIAEAETQKSLQGGKRLDEAAVRRMTGAIVNKFLHDPTRLLKSDTYHGDRQALVDLTRRLFDLDRS